MPKLRRTINFNDENPCPVLNMGVVGEHNATTIYVIPPESINECGADKICVAVETGDQVVRSQLQDLISGNTPEENMIVLNLSRDYTQHEYFNLQVEAYSSELNENDEPASTFVGKSRMIKGLRLAPAVEGENAVEGATPQTLTEAVAAMMPAVPIEKIATADGTEITPVSKKVTLPDTSAVEIYDTASNLKYTAYQIREFREAGREILFNGQPVLFFEADVYFSYFVVCVSHYGLRLYRINQPGTDYYQYGTMYFSRTENAEQNVIAAIKKADGTNLSVSSQTVTLPDFALASALANYYLKTDTMSADEITAALANYYLKTDTMSANEINTAIAAAAAEKISLPSSPNSGDALVYNGNSHLWEPGTPKMEDVSGLTGLEIYTRWTNKKALTYASQRILSVDPTTYNNQEGYFISYFVNSVVVQDPNVLYPEGVKRWFIPKNGTTRSIVGESRWLNNTEYAKLSNGAVASSNSSFVTGGQVFDALEEADITVVATSSKTIASSITGSNSVTWDTLTANKTLEQLLARVTAHKPIRVGGYLKSALSLSGSEETFTNSYIYQPWEVIYTGKVEGGWLADEMGCNLEDADPESYGVVVRVSQRYTSSGNMKFSAVAQQDIIVYKDTNGDTKVTYLGSAF